MVIDCEIARPLWSVNGVFSLACGSSRTAEEASGLFPHARGRARPSDPHSEQPVYVYEWASVCAYPCHCVCVYVCARGLCVCMCVCTYICRENVSTVAGFRHFSATDIRVSVGFYEDLTPRGCLGSDFSRCLRTNGNNFRDYFVFNVSCCVTA